MKKPKAIKDLEIKPTEKAKKRKKVLITFQVEPELREAANSKSEKTIITLSAFLRKCTIAFISNKEIEKQSDRLINQTVSAALNS